jgi:hypothetical protein
MSACEDALICDLAETYHILDYKGLPPSLVATLACGLRDNSRVMMHFSGNNITFERLLMARIADDSAFLAWSKTKDAQKGHGRPQSIVQALTGRKEKDFETYQSPDDFKAAWAHLTGANDG